MTYSISELFSYFGGFLGIILSAILLFRAKGKASVRISLALYLLIASIAIILGPLTYSGKILYVPHLLRLDSPIHYLFPPIGFFFVYSVFKPWFRFRWIHMLNFLPFLFNVVQFIPFYIQDAAYKTAYYNTYLATHGSIVMPLHYFVKSVSVFIYFALQLYVFLRFKSKTTANAGILPSIIIWFWIFLSGEAIMVGGMFMDQLTDIHFLHDPYLFSLDMITFFVYDIALALMFFPAMLYGNDVRIIAVQHKEKYERSKLTADEKSVILEKLNDFLKDKEKPYLNPKITLQEVSVILGVGANHLSQVINEKAGLNFNDYINLHRVDEARTILASPEYRNLTIEAIAKMAGFNSKSPFYIAFKKHAGMTPKEFVALHLPGN